MSTINEINTNKINNFKKITHKPVKKADLLKKYFYKLNLSPKKVNIFQLMKNGLANEDELEAVDNACLRSLNCKNELEKKKIDCLKSMILHHKQIPEQWIIQSNYKDLLNKVMSDPIILSYAIFSKDMFKKRSTSVSLDINEIKTISEDNSMGPKFISYINPYSKNYSDSIEKHKLMREYCYNIKHKKNRVYQNINNYKSINLTENSSTLNNKDNIKVIHYLNTESTKANKLPNIFPNVKLKKVKKNKKNEKDDKGEKGGKEEKDEKEDTFMMTSLYYDENNLTKDNKLKINNNNEKRKNNDEIKDEKNKNKKEIELPAII